MRLWFVVAVTVIAWPGIVGAVVVDSFDSGAILRGPESTELQLTQDGLPSASVIGGAREWVAFYGGSLVVQAANGGSLTLNYDRGPFEIASLRYGEVVSGSTMAPLNSDFT